MSLVLQYPFNDAATFLVDATGNSNTLTDVNGVESVTDTTYGTVASFSDNPTKYFSLEEAPATTTGAAPRTFAYWLKQVGNDTYRIIHGQGTTSNGGTEYRVQFSSNSLDINGGTGSSSNPGPTGQWVHIAISYDGTTERIYFDGSSVKTTSITYNVATGPLFIGSATTFASGYSLDGYMLDFRIYDDALSDTDINTLFTEGPNPEPSFIDVTATFYDGVDVEWDPVTGATSYRVLVNDVAVSTTTETTHSARGYADGDVLNIQVQSSTDDTTYTDAEYRSLSDILVQIQFSSLLSNPTNYPRPVDAVSFLDPYNPEEYILRRHGQNIVATYNIATDAYTELNSFTLSLVTEMRYNYQDRRIIGIWGSNFIDLGIKAEYLGIYTSQDDLGSDHLFYTHTSTILFFDISFLGVIHFSTVDNEVWSVNTDGSNAQLLFSTTGTLGAIATDPHDPDTLVYVDGDDIKYRVLSTGVTTDVIVGNMSNNTGIVVLNGVVYTNYFFKPGVGGYISVNLDGVTNLYEFTPSFQSYVWSFGFVVDTVNKTAYTLEDNEIFAHVDGNIADLPADPAPPIVDPGTSNYSLPLLHFPMNTSTLVTDVSVSGTDLRNSGVTTVEDSERGTVASFDDSVLSQMYLVLSDVPTEMFGSNPRTFIFWMKHQGDNTGASTLFHLGSRTASNRLMVYLTTAGSIQIDIAYQSNSGTIQTTSNKWHYIAVTIDDTEISVYIDGVLDRTWEVTIDTTESRLTLGSSGENDSSPYNGLMTEFRVYGTSWSSTEITEDYLSSVTLILSPSVVSIGVIIGEVQDAVSYRLSIQKDGVSEETIVHDSIQPGDLSQIVVSLVPEATYTILLYVDIGDGYAFVASQDATTLDNTADNYDLSHLESGGIVDTTTLTGDTKALIDEVANDLFTTGDVIGVNITDSAGGSDSIAATFVNLNSTIEATVPEGIIVPFTSGSGSGQMFTIEVENDTDQVVGYNELTNSIVVDGVEYAVNESFILNGRRFEIQEF